MRPSAGRVGVGQRVIAAVTISPGAAPSASPARHLHIHDEPPIERHDEPVARVIHVVAADDALGPALEHADDAPFGAAAVAPMLDAHDDAVAVHGLVEIVARDEDALGRVGRIGRARLGIDKRKSARIRGHSPDDEIHPIGQTEPLAADLDERTGLRQAIAQRALERGPFVARDAKAVKEFFDRGWMIDPVANERENFVF